jgi:hypothetical protein
MQKLAFEFCQHFNMSFTLMPISYFSIATNHDLITQVFCYLKLSLRKRSVLLKNSIIEYNIVKSKGENS